MELESSASPLRWSSYRNRTNKGRPDRYSPPTPLRYPDLADQSNAIQVLVIVLPFVLIVLLCTLTYCCYRWRKISKSRREFDRSQDAHDLPPSTIIYNNQYNPFTIEDLPPAYESLSNTKKIALAQESTKIPPTSIPMIVLTPANQSNSIPLSPI